MIVGLTGGIASGKSTASKILKKLGAKIIDADKLAKEISNRIEVIEEIQNKICSDILNEENKIDRKKLKEIVFNDKKKLEILNNIFHPKVMEELKKIKSNHLKNDIIVFDIPLLFESGIDSMCEETILVYINKKTQIERIVKRDKITIDMAKKIINSQMSLEEKKKRAGILIDNNKSYWHLNQEVNKIYAKIQEKIKIQN